jgi:hypothetical protein
MKKPVSTQSASVRIAGRIKELGDWRGKTLANVRDIIRKADPEIVDQARDRHSRARHAQ